MKIKFSISGCSQCVDEFVHFFGSNWSFNKDISKSKEKSILQYIGIDLSSVELIHRQLEIPFQFSVD